MLRNVLKGNQMSTSTRIRWAGLTGRERNGVDGASFVLLHGLTFDRRMWGPILDALPEHHRAIAFDLPGHGGSTPLGRRGLTPVVDALHDAVVEAGLENPIVVGHSIGGPIASIYAATYEAAAVVSIEAPLRVEPFAQQLASMRDQLTGTGFAGAWAHYQASWRMDLVPQPQRELLRAVEHGSQDVVLSYQSDLLERPLDEVVEWRNAGLRRLRDKGTPYLSLHSNPVDPADVRLLGEQLPQAYVVVWPVGHHFPHLHDPTRFAAVLTGLAAAV
jgi:pimeloyl-ACP methyl ester carboxylesterase